MKGKPTPSVNKKPEVKSVRASTEKLLETLGIVDGALRQMGIPEPAVEILKGASSPFHVLIMTLLSLRTRDPVTVDAFNRLCGPYPDAKSLAVLDEAEIGKLIFPVGFYRTKARTIKRISQELVENGEREPPKTLEELQMLPGVGLKTATLVLSSGWGMPEICVDTHVHRIVNRWGTVRTKTPDDTYHALSDLVPSQWKSDVNRVLVAFGQSVCKPVSPYCSRCPLTSAHCDRIEVDKHR